MVSRTFPNAKELLAKFNAGLKIIKSNGFWDSLAAKYNLSK
jgi:ABC-type amino acid transport substrate-binding protein